MDARRRGRANQRSRTRKDLLQAASRLMGQGAKPTLEQVAEEAMVSRATAYRYFSNVDALLLEAALDVAVPEPEELLRDAPAEDALARVMRVDDALHEMTNANEAQIRMMLARSSERWRVRTTRTRRDGRTAGCRCSRPRSSRCVASSARER